jgi:PEP-CTERM motif
MEVIMKLRIALLIILCFALAAVPVVAQSYNNGPINGTTDAWTINFGYVVSDTFNSNGGTVTGFMIGVWEFPGDSVTSVDYSITSGESSGTSYGSGTARVTDSFLSTNQYGYNIDKLTASGLNVSAPSGTLWLNLQNAVVPSGDPVYWDENSGPSQASQSAAGTIPSEAFTIHSCSGCTCDGSSSPDCGPPTPEPSSILLLGSGILGLASLIRRKLNL